ncbi:MAG: hypothetical protein DRI86_10450 [Bacteroidetes bacterium]|nr:MAG: hypothetical protein DRI86_10450 [Bacteroidota bacterium]
MIDNNTNPKYIAIKTKGKELFWKHGVKRISIEEICREANVSKMTFYKYFPNKVELVISILDDLIASSMLQFDKLVNSDMSFSEILENIFIMKLEAIRDFSPEFLNDIYVNPQFGLDKHLNSLAEKSQKKVKDFYEDSQKKGFIRKEVNIDFVMAYSYKMQDFIKDEKLMAQFATPKDFIMEAMNMLFYGIVAKDK